MNRLVLHHSYGRSAFDLSDNRNHGVAVSVTAATGADAPGFVFADPRSEVRVLPGETLSDPWSIRALVVFKLDPPGGMLTRRHNLMEGHLSFALYVGPDASLLGTVLDARNAWTGARSAPGVVKVGDWHTAELVHDGINVLRLALDGVEVASEVDAPGPVRAVGPNGLAIGHWPEPSGQYTFEGTIREAKLWVYDPIKDANGLLDPCCLDRAALGEAVTKLRERGASADEVAKAGRNLLGLGGDLMAAVRGGDRATTEAHQQATSAALAAFLRADQAGYTTALAQLAMLTRDRLSAEVAQEFHAREEELVESLPLPFDELAKLVGALCWDRVGLDPQQLIDTMDQFGRRAGHTTKGAQS